MTISLMAGGVLFSAATGFAIAAAAPVSGSPVPAPAATHAGGAFLTALTGAAYPATSLQCKALNVPAGSGPGSGSTPPLSAPGTATTAPPGTGSTTPPPTGTSSPPATDTSSPPPTDTGSPSPTDSGTPTPTDTGSPTPTGTEGSPASTDTPSAPASSPTDTPSPTPDSSSLTSTGAAVASASLTAFRVAARSAAAAQPELCVGVERAQGSIKHGQSAQWVVSVYTTGAGATNVTAAVAAAPVGQRASFDFGCGGQNGTAACKLGQVKAGTPVHQVQAQIAVPARSDITAVRLTATVSADHLPVRPQAAVTVVVAAGIGAPTRVPVDFLTDPALRNASFLPVLNGSLSAKTTLSPGGNAAGLFPEIVPGASSGSGLPNGVASRAPGAVALLSADLPVAGGQVAGLAALALALLLAAVPRLRVRLLGMARQTARLVRPTP